MHFHHVPRGPSQAHRPSVYISQAHSSVFAAPKSCLKAWLRWRWNTHNGSVLEVLMCVFWPFICCHCSPGNTHLSRQTWLLSKFCSLNTESSPSVSSHACELSPVIEVTRIFLSNSEMQFGNSILWQLNQRSPLWLYWLWFMCLRLILLNDSRLLILCLQPTFWCIFFLKWYLIESQ